jgi:electron transfer flavoprotein alpha subunit
MAQVLVVVDAVDGSVPKPTLELLTLARRIGSPAAAVFGPASDRAVDTLASYGASEVYLVKDSRVLDHLVVPKVAALEQIARPQYSWGPAQRARRSGPGSRSGSTAALSAMRSMSKRAIRRPATTSSPPSRCSPRRLR